MRHLVLGQSGQLARALAAAGAGPCLGRDRADLAIPGAAAAAIHAARPQVVINTAAYTAVDRAETDRAAAFRVNAEAVGEIAAAAADAGAALVHVSTDYVFDGARDGPYREDDPVGPLNVYGASKLAGEQVALAANRRSVILRTAWVHAPWGRNFVTTMLRLGAECGRLRVVADQRGSPTSALDLADACLAVARRLAHGPDGAAGIYHFAGAGGAVSRADFAAEIFRQSAARGGPCAEIEEIDSADHPTAAVRPANSELDSGRFSRTFGLPPPPWRPALARVIESILTDLT